MNREERRRQAHKQRRADRGKRPVLVVGDGIIAAEIPGHTYEARRMAKLRPKVPGKHRWMAIGSWVLSDEFAAGAMDPDLMKYLDNENLFDLSIGCWDCEQPITSVGYGSVCPADGDDG